ncbi:hypothetical protein ACFTZI_02035 [Streptomyces decoyicus]|uniref:hypothetical protein n=1 Tax=Streptomyces decoyicus TaxID=249567 RepID=UPI0036442AE1
MYRFAFLGRCLSPLHPAAKLHAYDRAVEYSGRDMPCCPLLLVNGKDDLQNTPADFYLTLEHRGPKAARMFPGGPMGEGPVLPTVLDWIAGRLS